MRRVLVFAVWLAAPGAYAQVRSAPPIQLSLSFAAPVAAIVMPAAAIGMPQPLAVVPALAASPLFVAPPTPVLAAFHSGDPAAYLRAARAAEYRPPDGDDHQNALYQLGLEREAAERAFRASRRVEVPVARATAIDYDEFGRQLARHTGLSLNPFQHADAKRRILKAAGYSRLYGAGGVPVAIERAADVRVGKAFENVHRAFKRR